MLWPFYLNWWKRPLYKRIRWFSIRNFFIKLFQMVHANLCCLHAFNWDYSKYFKIILEDLMLYLTTNCERDFVSILSDLWCGQPGFQETFYCNIYQTTKSSEHLIMTMKQFGDDDYNSIGITTAKMILDFIAAKFSSLLLKDLTHN